MIPAGEMILETNPLICDRWCPQVPVETMETRIQVKKLPYMEILLQVSVSLCVFYCLSPYIHLYGILGTGNLWIQVNLPAGFFTGFLWVPPIPPNPCYPLYTIEKFHSLSLTLRNTTLRFTAISCDVTGGIERFSAN